MSNPRRRLQRSVTTLVLLALMLVAVPVVTGGEPNAERPPDGTHLVAVEGGGQAYCGIRPNGRLVCWARFPDEVGINYPASLVRPPDGSFTAVSVGEDSTACGIRTDRRALCWGADYGGMASPPKGRYIAIGTGMSSACAIRADRTIVCWGMSSVVPPAGTFTTLGTGQDVYCAIRTDETVACWGDPVNAPYAGGFTAPDGAFSGI